MVNHTQLSNGFVICGNLYLVSFISIDPHFCFVSQQSLKPKQWRRIVLLQVESSSDPQSSISTAYDFYRGQYSTPDIKWINLYRDANMISYNPYDKRVYVYDHGYLLTSPARLHWLAR